ncbi:MAG: Bax inhibitor-1/YccA family protein [Lentisphaeria bacterium]|nr:Bax inhibitor-1/YccA family protein [Lentisphaeria bacterium]
MYDESRYEVRTENSSNSLARAMTGVYWWMTFALIVSGLSAWMVGTSPELSKLIIGNQAVFMILALVEIGMVIGISAGINKLSAATATALFILYAAINGLTLSVIFIAYRLDSIAVTFAVTAGTFGVMAVVGTVTRADLSKLGSLLMMALFGLIIASIVNIFWFNKTLYWICTYAGVLIFVGLTAYDVQKIKKMYINMGTDNPETVRKIAVLGALSLYLDFVNLLLYLLRIFGRRR